MVKEVPYSLLAKFFSGNCSEEEKLQVTQWQKANAENEELFRETGELWKHSKTEGKGFNPKVEQALLKVNQRLGVEKSKASHKVTRMVHFTRRIAAVLLVGACVWVAWQVTHKKSVNPAFIEVVTLQGEKKEVTLPDDSHVWLNSSSKLKYAAKFEGSERKVAFEGEAYFEVAKNPSRPFIINAGTSVTTVLGTAFNLRARTGEKTVSVTVAEGKVAFTGKEMPTQNAVKLIAGDQGVLNLETKQLARVKNDDPNFLAWKTGKLIFKNTALKQVVAKLTEFYGKNIRVDDISKAEIPFTSTFDHKPLHDVITIMEISLGLKADTINHVIILK
jgi:ferric-dicitrate binding protein FerR (iron transport regulator)